MRAFSSLVMLLALACVPTAPRSTRAVPAAAVPLEVENRTIDDVTVYLVDGASVLKLGRAPGMQRTILPVPRVFVGHTVHTAARWLSGAVEASPRFVLDEEGATMTIDPRAVDGRPRA